MFSGVFWEYKMGTLTKNELRCGFREKKFSKVSLNLFFKVCLVTFDRTISLTISKQTFFLHTEVLHWPQPAAKHFTKNYSDTVYCSFYLLTRKHILL